MQVLYNLVLTIPKANYVTAIMGLTVVITLCAYNIFLRVNTLFSILSTLRSKLMRFYINRVNGENEAKYRYPWN